MSTPGEDSTLEAPSKVRIVLIAGMYRSGSTLASRLLNELPGWTAVGEVLHLLTDAARGVPEDELALKSCGCGLGPADCSTWGPIVETLVHARRVGRVPPATANPILRPHPIRRRLPQFIWTPSRQAELDRSHGFDAILETTYRALAGPSADVVVDESKSPRYAYLLDSLPWVDLTIVHLVRDPRGVVYSLSRPKAHMRATPTSHVARGWIAHNLEAEVVTRHSRRRALRVRYEDLVHDPDEFVRRVASATGDAARIPAMVGPDRTVTFGPNHLFDANPDKFNAGPTRIALRDEWKQALSRRTRAAVTAATLPLLVRYGYSVAPGGTARGASTDPNSGGTSRATTGAVTSDTSSATSNV